VISFKIDNDLDFIILGCNRFIKLGDGIYDQLTDQEVTECIWLSLQETIREKNIHLQCGVAVDLVLKSSLLRRSLDNVTCVLIVFENFEKCYNNNASNFNFSTHNSALSTFNSINTPNNNRNMLNDIQDEKSNINANKSYITNSTNNNSEVSNKSSFETFKFSSSNLMNLKLDQSIKDKSVNFQNKSLKSESPDRFKGSKVGLSGAPKSDTQITKYFSKVKKEKTIDINLTNYLTNSQKLKTPNKNINQEDSLPYNLIKKLPSTTKNFKKNDTLHKFQKK
jgi:hypothetical protein